MVCKHLNIKTNVCNIKNKKPESYECNRCLLKIGNYTEQNIKFNFKGTPFEDLMNNFK